ETGADDALAVALTVTAIPFWEHLSLVEECRARAEHALHERFAPYRSERDTMKLYTALGTTLLHTRGPVPDVKSAWTCSLQVAERNQDVEYQLRSLWGLCDYHTWIGDHRTAHTFVSRIRELARQSGDMAASTNVERQAGTTLRYLGELTEARRKLENMIARYLPPVVRSDTARFQLDPRSAARGTLANVLWLQGFPDRAVATAQQQLAEAHAAKHALALCNALIHCACPVALWVGDLERAEQLLALIDVHVASHSMAIWRGMSACLRAEWLLGRGDARGLPMLRSALDQLFETGFRLRAPAHLGVLASGLAAHGDSDAARTSIDSALDMAADSGEAWCMPELLRVRGDVLRAAGRALQAEELYWRALELARSQEAQSWGLRAAISLTELRRDEQAGRTLEELYAGFEEGFETRDLRRARSLLAELR
ncbi:MAG TPA: hypothetical protein VMF89_37390, partial [Polyangiales bacterium]|nr:hypothetical protein [Polyangiales bacterium]